MKKVGYRLKKRINYYPFGLQHKGYNNTITGREHQYKYNGTELTSDLGYNMYEMPLRAYDPAIARWNRIDPVVHHGLSPYNAFDNNPVFYSDPSGGNSWTHIGGGSYQNDDGIVTQDWEMAVSETASHFGDGFTGFNFNDFFEPIDTNGDNNSCCDNGNPFKGTEELEEAVVKGVNKRNFPAGFNWSGDPRLDYALAVGYRDKWNNHFSGFSGNFDAGWYNWDPDGLGNFVMNTTSSLIGNTLMSFGPLEFIIGASQVSYGPSRAVTLATPLGDDVATAASYISSFKNLAPGFDDIVMHGEQLQKMSFMELNQLLNARGIEGNIRLWICGAAKSGKTTAQGLANWRQVNVLASPYEIEVSRTGYRFLGAVEQFFTLYTPK
ncbi:RHS repeat-associated core domain-containing protein [Aquimarina sp. M1]